jgi:hypothetical protein
MLLCCRAFPYLSRAESAHVHASAASAYALAAVGRTSEDACYDIHSNSLNLRVRSVLLALGSTRRAARSAQAKKNRLSAQTAHTLELTAEASLSGDWAHSVIAGPPWCARRLAFGMTLQARLGVASPATILPDEVAGMVATHLQPGSSVTR